MAVTVLWCYVCHQMSPMSQSVTVCCITGYLMGVGGMNESG